LNYLQYIQNNFPIILDYAKTHFSLVLWAVVISLLLWVPVGVLITKNEKWQTECWALPTPFSAFPVCPCLP